MRNVDISTHFSSRAPFLVQNLNKYRTRKGIANHFSCYFWCFYRQNVLWLCRTYTVKNVRKEKSFVLADFWRGNKTLLDRSHLKTVQAWKISQFLRTVRCVSPSSFPYISPMCYFISTPLLVQSAFETVICVPDRRTDQVFEPCKWDMQGKIYVSLLSKCQSQEILPYVYSTFCHGVKLLFVESWERGGGWRGKEKLGNKKNKYPNTSISFQIRIKKHT
jgi:hypothetical protein